MSDGWFLGRRMPICRDGKCHDVGKRHILDCRIKCCFPTCQKDKLCHFDFCNACATEHGLINIKPEDNVCYNVTSVHYARTKCVHPDCHERRIATKKAKPVVD